MTPGRPMRGATWAAAALLLTATTVPFLRRWYLTWGATPEETRRTLPGDDLLSPADMISTRAITIDVPPERVWPWLVQMGSGRGGAYTYDWIENLFGLGMHSADRILPEFQNLDVGDVLPMGQNGPGMRVEVCEPGRALAFRSEDGQWVWSFTLTPEGGGTRLVSRNRIAETGASTGRRLADRLIMEPGSLVMERKMLRGIRDRAQSEGKSHVG
ncbi:SRPBCC family protein [Actinoplanes sp. NPDC049265]|uniref:SRPBCC family protein n=1 Tax=Actinoplanes sp. NPDC049265 TaxID=3363902 RepID=UPI00372379FF